MKRSTKEDFPTCRGCIAECNRPILGADYVPANCELRVDPEPELDMDGCSYHAPEPSEPKMQWAVYAGGECLDGRYNSPDVAARIADAVSGDFPDMEVGVDVSPEWQYRDGGATCAAFDPDPENDAMGRMYGRNR